ncbi:hypothetical protein BEL05_18955 [Shewanella colwelliana]|uniref:Dystroglycan-type cadherin-like domain-containing protein n=1 Tax=Shewanella colwelliana TaxID=23 RepID=A0A1E5IVM9_SHECO|nr:putative Ig domain-containing protein [Shewanella colwelliana]OEG74517.1 hypothetical protein BEL05_18955 [Shewanella colwelliana]
MAAIVEIFHHRPFTVQFHSLLLALLTTFGVVAAENDLSLSGALSSSTVAVGNTSTLTYTLSNSSSTESAANIDFVINLPIGVVVAAQTNELMTCTTGGYSLVAGGATITATGYQLGQSQSCKLRFNVTASGSGPQNITSTGLTSSIGNGLDSSTTLNASSTNVSAVLSFSPASVSVGNISTLNLALSNPDGESFAYGFSGKVNLPTGLTIAPVANFTTDCGDYMTLTETSGASSVTLSSISFNNSLYAFLDTGPTTCNVSVDVIADIAGELETYTNGMVYQNFANSIGQASGLLSVQRQFVNMALDPLTVLPGQTANLNVSLTNFDRSNNATNISFTDDLDAALAGLVATGLPLTDVCGAGSSITGTSVLSLNSGVLGAGDSCSFSVPVTIPLGAALGTYSNTVTSISSSLNGAYADVTNTFNVSNAPTLSLTVVETGLTAGDAMTLRYTLTNVDAANAITDLSVSTLVGDASVAAITTLPGSNFCNGSGSSATSVSSDLFSIDLSSLALAAGASCTFDAQLQLNAGLNSGSYSFTAKQIVSTINGDSVSSQNPSASATITVDAAPSLSFAFRDDVMLPGTAGFIDFELLHHANSSADATATGFSVDLEAGLTGLVATSLPITDACGVGSTVTGTSVVTLSGATVNLGESCTFSVPVQLPLGTVGSNFNFSSSDVTATVNGNAVTKSGGAASLAISGLTFTKSFGDDSILVGSGGTSVSLTYLLTNEAGAGDATAGFFTDSFSGFISGTTITSLDQTGFCGAGSSTTGTGGNVLVASGIELANGQQCTLTVTLNIPSSVSPGNYHSNSSGLSATVGGIGATINPAVARLAINELTVVTSVDVSSPTSETTINMSIEFSDVVTGFNQSLINVVNGTLANFAGSGASYAVEVTPSADGDVTIQIAAGVVVSASDATVSNKAATDIVVNYQTVPLVPTPSLSISGPSSSLVSSGPVTYTVNYVDVEQVDLTDAKVVLNKTGSANADITVIDGDLSTAIISLDNLVGDGSLGVSIVVGTARYSTNLAPAAGPSSVFVVDTHQPTTTLTTAAVNQTGDFTLNIAFEENVTGFEIGDIAVTNATLSDFQSSDAKNYSVLVSASGETSISLSVPDGAAADSAGNANSVSNLLSITYDDVAPSVSISGPTGTVIAGFTATIDFTEVVTGFDIGDIQATNATLSGFTNVDGKQFTVAVTPLAQASVVLAIDANVAMDALTNNNTAANSYSVIYDFNDAPTISGVPATSVNEDSPYSFLPAANDADLGDSLSFTIVNKPIWASFDSATGLLSGVPTNDHVGATADIIITVSDGALSSSLSTFSLTVVNTNDAPTISGMPATSVNEDSAYSFTPTAADVDSGDSLSFVISNMPTWASFNGATGQLIGTPTNDDVGITSGIVIGVSDGTVTTNLAAFGLTVINTNDAPTISGAPATSVNEDSAYSFTPTAADVDSGDNLSFVIANKPTWASFNSATGQLSGTPTNDDVGSTSGIVIGVNDGTLTTNLAAFSLTVVNTNDAPTISGTPATSVNEDSAYSFTPTAADVDSGDSLSFVISNMPTWASFNGATGQLIGTPTNDDVGITSGIVIGVSDGTVTTNLTAFAITVVNSNDAPVIGGTPNVSVDEDTLYSFTPTVTEDDSTDTLSFIIANKPAWAQFSVTDGTLTGTPTNDDVGVTTNVLISVSDGTIQVDLPAFDIEVVNVNDAPIFESEPIIAASVLAPYQYDVMVSDVDVGDSLNVSLVSAPEWLSLNSANQLVGTPPVEAADTSELVELSVTDSIVDTPVLQSFTIDISQPTDTELDVNIYFSPAPATVGQSVNLVVDLANQGYTAAKGVKYHITLGSELSLNNLPTECSDLGAGVIDCLFAEDLAIDAKLTRIVDLTVDNVDTGFCSATLTVSGDNLNGAVFDDSASILLANTLSILPGKVLTSVPANLGYAVDMNGDMFSDLLIYLPNEMAVQVMLNDGFGQLIADVKVAVEQGVTALTATDINLDGAVDIITTGGSAQGNRAYLLDSEFALINAEALDDVQADIILIADLDLDGNPEVALAGIYQPQVAIYSGVGTGATSVTLLPIPTTLPSLSAAKGMNKVDEVTKAPLEMATGVTALTAISGNGVTQLLVGVDNQAPVLLTLEDSVWVAKNVPALTQHVQQIISSDVNDDGHIDLLTLEDDGWHLIINALTGEFVESKVVFPQAENIIVTDLEADGVAEILLVMPHGVSIWHYYDVDDIRPDEYVIDTKALGTVALVDFNNDGLLDIVTFDNQDGVAVWYVSAGGGVGPQDVDLSLFSSGPSFPKYGEPTSMVWSVFNRGDATATEVVYSVTLDSALLPTQLPGNCSLDALVVSCRLGELAVGETAEVMLWVIPEKAHEFTLSGMVTSSEHDTDDSNNHRDVSFTVLAPNAPESDAGSVPLWAVLLLLLCALASVNRPRGSHL